MNKIEKPVDRMMVDTAYRDIRFAHEHLGLIGEPFNLRDIDNVRVAVHKATQRLADLLDKPSEVREQIELGDFVAVAGETKHHLWDVFRYQQEKTSKVWVGEMMHAAVLAWKGEPHDQSL